ncbi:MAG: hypothetical protein V4672_08615 [Verrucomicrobiota bacterium]
MPRRHAETKEAALETYGGLSERSAVNNDNHPINNIQNLTAMKHAPTAAGALLGLLFVTFGLNFFLNFIPMPADPSPADAPHKLFMAALFPTGYLAFVKVLEITGGLLVALPKTRNIGLLILGPIVVNILAFHVFLTKGAGLFEPPVLLITAVSAYLLFAGRRAFAGLLKA